MSVILPRSVCAAIYRTFQDPIRRSWGYSGFHYHICHLIHLKREEKSKWINKVYSPPVHKATFSYVSLQTLYDLVGTLLRYTIYAMISISDLWPLKYKIGHKLTSRSTVLIECNGSFRQDIPSMSWNPKFQYSAENSRSHLF